jgi:hypothetical protein
VSETKGTDFLIMNPTHKDIFGLFLFCIFCIAVPVANAQGVDKVVAPRAEYEVGQKWSYHARPGEESSYLLIVKIDKEPKLGTIVHIALSGLKVKNRRSRNGLTENANHLPFSKDAIDKSVLKLLKENVDLPDFEGGYRLWREAFEAKRAGIYTITVAEAVSVMEASLNQ